MGRDDEFGPDTETIRAWLAKRATYAKDARVIGVPDSPPTAPVVEAAPTAPTAPPAPAAGPDTRVAGRSVVEALRAPEPEPAAPVPAPPAPAVEQPVRATASEPAKGVRVSTPVPRTSYQASSRPAPEAVAPAPVVRRGRWTEPEANRLALDATTDVDFPVRGGARRALALVLLVCVAATGAMAYAASQERDPASIGIAGVLGFLTLVVWAVRAGCTTTQLSLRRGQLTIRRAGHVELVDIGSHHTPIAIVGEPGHRRWTVLLERPGLPLVVINASMVDPHWFTSALYRLRPELRPGHGVSRG